MQCRALLAWLRAPLAATPQSKPRKPLDFSTRPLLLAPYDLANLARDELAPLSRSPEALAEVRRLRCRVMGRRLLAACCTSTVMCLYVRIT